MYSIQSVSIPFFTSQGSNYKDLSNLSYKIDYTILSCTLPSSISLFHVSTIILPLRTWRSCHFQLICHHNSHSIADEIERRRKNTSNAVVVGAATDSAGEDGRRIGVRMGTEERDADADGGGGAAVQAQNDTWRRLVVALEAPEVPIGVPIILHPRSRKTGRGKSLVWLSIQFSFCTVGSRLFVLSNLSSCLSGHCFAFYSC